MASSNYKFLCEMVGQSVEEHETSTRIINSRDKRRNIKLKLFLNDDLADRFHQIDPSYSFILAKLFRDHFILNDENIQINNLNKLSSIKIKTTTILSANPAKFNKILDDQTRSLTDISHYLASPNASDVNIKTLNWDKAISLAAIYHSTIEHVIEDGTNYQNSLNRDDEEGSERFLTFPDGWYWVNLLKDYSKEESQEMSHCGRDSGMHILSLRDENGHSHVTASRSPTTKEIKQCRGKKNHKPSRKYHEYIVGLLLNKSFPITNLPNSKRFIYDDQSYGNFELSDLSWNPDLFNLVTKYTNIPVIKETQEALIINELNESTPKTLNESINRLIKLGTIKEPIDIKNNTWIFQYLIERFANRPRYLYDWVVAYGSMIGLEKVNDETLEIDYFDSMVLHSLYHTNQKTSLEVFSMFIEKMGCKISNIKQTYSINEAYTFYDITEKIDKSNVWKSPTTRVNVSILSNAINNNDYHWIKTILDADTDAQLLNTLDEDGLSPLHRAFSGRTIVFEILDMMLTCIHNNPNSNYGILSTSGKSLFHYTSYDYTGLIQPQVELLLEKTCNINIQDGQGLTPAMYAIIQNSDKALSVYLKYNADLSIQDANGNNAIHYAVKLDKTPILDVLKNHPGIDKLLFVKNKEELSPIDIIKRDNKSNSMLSFNEIISNLNINAIDTSEATDIVINGIINRDDISTLIKQFEQNKLSKNDFCTSNKINRLIRMSKKGSIKCMYYICNKYDIPLIGELTLVNDIDGTLHDIEIDLINVIPTKEKVSELCSMILRTLNNYKAMNNTAKNNKGVINVK